MIFKVMIDDQFINSQIIANHFLYVPSTHTRTWHVLLFFAYFRPLRYCPKSCPQFFWRETPNEIVFFQVSFGKRYDTDLVPLSGIEFWRLVPRWIGPTWIWLVTCSLWNMAELDGGYWIFRKVFLWIGVAPNLVAFSSRWMFWSLWTFLHSCWCAFIFSYRSLAGNNDGTTNYWPLASVLVMPG